MQTLSALKREAHNFKWSMIDSNSSFLRDIPDFLKAYRKVSRVQSNSIAFETLKDGKVSESWTDFPKASGVEIIADQSGYLVKFTQESGTYIQYHLVA
jgi:hypothetical protein